MRWGRVRTNSEPGTGYRPHLDGLRAIAVYLVVAYHAGADRLANGFIGVDVFFVLSGYLVTQILVRDVATMGRARFSNFYARRIRRLLPASLIALVITAVVYSALATPAAVREVVGSFQAALLYVANWHFIRHSTDYFASTTTLNPVLHFWSLAVEEQFYLLWPLAFTGLVFLSRGFGAHAHRVRQAMVAAGLLASMLWALHLAGTNLDRAVLRHRRSRLSAPRGCADRAQSRDPSPRRSSPRRPTGGGRRGRRRCSLLATDVVHAGPINRGIAIDGRDRRS